MSIIIRMTDAKKKTKRDYQEGQPLSEEALALLEHIAEILAEEFVKAVKKKQEEDADESSNLR